jgi:hypothetical protein
LEIFSLEREIRSKKTQFKKFLTIAVILFLPFFSAFSGNGDGTSGSPFEITNCTQLQEMQDNLAANYILIEDINCSDTLNWNGGDGFLSIGFDDGSGGLNSFTGNFDGQGYNIIDLYIKRNSELRVGLFGWFSGTVSNVDLENANISGSEDVGGLIGEIRGGGKVTNVNISGNVMMIGKYEIGGLVGANSNGSIENCYSYANVNGLYSVGGLTGYNLGTIINCSASGSIYGIETVGGLVGENFGTILNSYAAGNVLGFDFVGGLTGNNGDSYGEIRGFIDNSYATGNATGGDEVGGLVGDNTGTINNSYSLGFVNGTSNNGGLVGQNVWMILNSYSNSDINGWDVAGGLVGSNVGGFAIIDNSYSNGNIIGNSYLGGIAGAVENGSIINNSNATGNIYSNTFDNIFGVAGYLEGIIENSYFTGEIFYVNNITAPIIKKINPGGGGSRGGGEDILCISNKTFDWACPAWSECINGTQTRLCAKVDNCENASGRPETGRDCKNVEIIPILKLFDIKFELEDAVIKNSSELSSIIGFENFGNLSTLVNLTYKILNSSGTEVYFEKGNITVITEEIVRKNFENLNLSEGKYTLILTTIYDNNILDEFRQSFEVKEVIKIPAWVWIVLILVVVCIIVFIIYKLNKPKKEILL